MIYRSRDGRIPERRRAPQDVLALPQGFEITACEAMEPAQSAIKPVANRSGRKVLVAARARGHRHLPIC